jgi:flavin-dependent dehydrogenase
MTGSEGQDTRPGMTGSGRPNSVGLRDGGRVVIIGGGPGGVACGLLLQRLAWEANRRIDITILEGKQFSGARHHNLCAGVLTPPLPELLAKRLQVILPPSLDGREILGYILHSDHEQLPMDEHEPSIALRRVQYDNYMLESARKRGLRVVTARAVDLEFHSDRVVVYTESAPLEADVVVGAFGMDEGTAAIFARATGYRAPDALRSIVTRFHPGPEAMAAFGPRIHAFLSNSPGIEFGAVTPKDDHLTINIAGGEVTGEHIAAFLARPEVRAVLPGGGRGPRLDPTDFDPFKGRFPCSLARRYYGDRYVLVGDAAGLVRAFKGKGVTSAVQTGIRAAEAIFHAGVTEAAFGDHYARANRDITGDLIYGQSMRQLVRLSTRMGLIDPVLRAARQSPALREALLGAVSGNLSYREVYRDMLRPDAVAAIAKSMLRPMPRERKPGGQVA